MQFSIAEMGLLIAALKHAASRHEAQSRFRPASPTASEHDQLAADMRKLAARLEKAPADEPKSVRAIPYSEAHPHSKIAKEKARRGGTR